MLKPGSQRRGRGNFLQPEINEPLLFFDPTRPETIDKDAIPVLRTAGSIDTFDKNVAPMAQGNSLDGSSTIAHDKSIGMAGGSLSQHRVTV